MSSDVQVGNPGDVYDDSGPLSTNAFAVGSVSSDPFAVDGVTVDAPGGIAGVTPADVIAATDDGTPLGAAWQGTDVEQGSKVIIMMDINWLEPYPRRQMT